MTKRNIGRIAEDISRLDNGIYYIAIKDNKFHYTKLLLPNSIILFKFKKNSNNIDNIKCQLYNLMNKVSIQDGDKFEEYFELEAVLNNKVMKIKYQNNQWCSISRSK